jgi:hypothetical protein
MKACVSMEGKRWSNTILIMKGICSVSIISSNPYI